MNAPSPKGKTSQRIQIYHVSNRDYKWKFNSHFILWTPYHQFLTWGWKALIRNHDQDYAPIQATFSENMQERCVSLHPFSSTVQTISMFRWSAYHCGWTQGYLFSKKKSANHAVQIYCVLICRPHVSAGVLLLRETIVPHTTGIIHLPCPPHSIPKALTVATLSITLLWKNRAFQMCVSSGLWVKLIEGFWAQTLVQVWPLNKC